MRKFFALALAVAMVLSLASVSFAATASSEAVIALSDFHKYDADTNELKEAQAQYGKTYYAMIFEGKYNFPATPASGATVAFTYNPITKYDQVEKLKVKAEFEMGEDLVDSISIVKKAFDVDSIMQPNPAYAAASASDVAGNSWVNNTGANITAGTYTIKAADGTVVGTVTLAGDIADGKDLANATPAANGTIDKYDSFKIDSLFGTDLILDAADLDAIAAVTVIPDEIGAVQLEVKSKNDLVTGTATWNAGTRVWDETTSATELINAPATGKYYYFVEVKTKAERVTGDADVVGTFEFNRKGKDDVAKIDDCEVDFAFNLFYEKNYNANAAYKIDVEDSVEMKWDDLYVLKFDNDDEVEIEFGTEPNEGVFTVDVSGQGKLVIDFNTKANDAIYAANEGVEMHFINFNGAKFNRTGVFEYEMEDMVAAYKVEGDKLVEIAGLEMDGDTATFYTRTLGNYVFATAELVNPTVAVEAPVVAAPAVTNPSTGA